MNPVLRFRLVATIYLILEISAYIIYESINSHLPQYLKDYEALYSSYVHDNYRILFYVVLLSLVLVHVISTFLLMIKKWSCKYLYIISGMSLYLISPLYGPVIEHGFTAMISSVASIFFGMSVICLFWLSEKTDEQN